jgi:opacity protein-like surface antigen
MLFSLAGGAAGKGAMEIGLAAYYGWPTGDAQEFEPNYSYGMVFHYWLNDTSTVLVGWDMMSHEVPFTVDGEDENFLYNALVLYVGARYRPEVDIFFKPYLEGGMGYQMWSTNRVPKMVDEREGSSVAYFAGTGWEYDLAHTFTVGTSFRYYYMVMAEKMEERSVTTGPDSRKKYKDPFVNVGFATAGIELTWRFK